MKGGRNGIQWTPLTFEELDFDDLALLSHNQNQRQKKKTRQETTSAGIGLTINPNKTDLMKISPTAKIPVTVGDKNIKKSSPSFTLGMCWTD